jgi:hypothetical protein
MLWSFNSPISNVFVVKTTSITNKFIYFMVFIFSSGNAISSPNIQTVVFPEQKAISVCIVFAEPYLDLNLKFYQSSYRQTSIIFPENSLSTAFEIQVDILE